MNMKVTLPTGAVGTITGTFGKSGKFKVHFPSGFGYPDTKNGPLNEKLSFVIKRYVFDKDKKLRQ